MKKIKSNYLFIFCITFILLVGTGCMGAGKQEKKTKDEAVGMHQLTTSKNKIDKQKLEVISGDRNDEDDWGDDSSSRSKDRYRDRDSDSDDIFGDDSGDYDFGKGDSDDRGSAGSSFEAKSKNQKLQITLSSDWKQVGLDSDKEDKKEVDKESTITAMSTSKGIILMSYGINKGGLSVSLDDVADEMKESYPGEGQLKTEKIKIGSYNALRFEVHEASEGKKLYMQMYVVDTPHYISQITFVTDELKADSAKSEIEKIAQTYKENE